ncbi:deoxyribonuclease HsdR [Pasteurellaceae bacterium Macca]|nr:deoxyribonuclease HsdR [Pasteurellaceae bacterium Macca]
MKKCLFLALFSLFLTACATTAGTNAKAASQYANAKAQYTQKGVLDNGSSTALRVKKVFNTMVPYAKRENQTGVPFDWEIMVIKSNELNAWAMPGGKMAFYTGIVERLNLTDDEIATVMGHEMAHALKEHGKSSTNRSAAIDSLFAIANVAITAATGVDSGNLLGLAKDLGVDKPFSRGDESEADEIGLYLMAKSGYNPKFAPQVWVKMNQATGGGGGFFSTHPADKDRQQNLEKWLPKAMEYYNARR